MRRSARPDGAGRSGRATVAVASVAKTLPSQPTDAVAVRARLFDADGHDREIDPAEVDREAIGERRLLWIDIDVEAVEAFDVVAEQVGLSGLERTRIEADTGRARLLHQTERLHLTIEAVESERGPLGGPLVRREIDLVAYPGVVISCHRGPVSALERFVQPLAGETALGSLQAADLLSSLADEVVTGYQEIVEGMEQEIDRLDQAALHGAAGESFLGEVVAIRQRIGFLRRTLAPHRAALAALARPEMGTDDTLGQPWPGFVSRIEATLVAIESLRDALLGTFDIYLGRSAQRTNDTMRLLTVVSVVLLPAVVLAGVMGMNFEIPFFTEPSNFYVVLGAMLVISVLVLAVARRRSWL